MRLILLFLVSLVVTLSAAQSEIPPHPKSYVCYKTNSNFSIDGKLAEPDWTKASWTDLFLDIEGSTKPKPTYDTRAKMLWNESSLFIAIRMEEPHIWATLEKRESIIYRDNDIEVFIDPNGDNHHYAELEFNAYGTIMDLLLTRPYSYGVEPSFNWNCTGLEHAINIEGTINDASDIDTAWTIEMAIPLSAIADLVYGRKIPEAGDQWRLGYSRVQWDVSIEDGKYVKLKKPEHNWTWSPQWAINMHKPELWGYLQFSDVIIGTGIEAFSKDKYWSEKMQLMTVYEALLKYHSKTGTYRVRLTDLELPAFVVKSELSMESTTEQFMVSYQIDNGLIKVDHFGLISFKWEE